MELVIGLFAVIMGGGIAVIWSIDIASGRGFDRTHGWLRAREEDSGSLMLPHWLAEYGTAVLLGLSGLLLIATAPAGEPVALVALGALAYTSCNSLGWSLARRDRFAYAVPMLIGLTGSLLALTALALS